MGSLVFDAVYNSEGVMRGVRESQRAFAELRSSAENEGRKIDAAFNRQIYEGSQSVNALTGKIIDQKKTVRSLTKDIDTLTESYKKVSPDSVKGKDLFASLTNAKSMLKNKKEELLELQTQQAQVRLSVRKLRDEYSLYQKEGQNVVESNNNMALSFKKTLAAIGGVAAIKQFVSEVLKVRGQFQQLDVAFTTLLQSKEKANALMAQMVQTAAKTPFNLTELATGAKQLVAYGFASEGVNDTLIRLGNIASGLGLPLERLTYLYGTTMTQGRLYARDLMQFTTSGIPMLQGLADMFGVSTDKVNEMITAGKIGFPEVQKVIENMTNEGGKFFNLMEEQSKTITGKISNLGDAWDEMLNKIGQSQEGAINGSIDGLKYMIENYEKIGSILLSLIEIYGVYRTACIAHIVLTQSLGTTQIMLGATMAKLRSSFIALTASMNLNPLVLAATAIIGLGVVMWNLADNTDAATKAQESFNKKVEDAAQKAQDHKQKLEGLISELQNEVTAETRKMEIIDKIKKGYPSLFQKFIDEKGHVKDLTAAWKAFNEEASKNKAIQNKTNASDLKQSIDDMKRIQEVFNKYGYDFKSYTKNDLSLYQKYKPYEDGDLKENIEKSERELWKWEKEVMGDEFTQWKVDLKSKTDAQIEASRSALVKRVQAANGDKHLLASFGKRIIAIDEEKNVRKANAVTYGNDFYNAKTEWETAKKELDTIEKDKDKYTRTQYDNAKKREEAAQKAYKDLGGITNTTKQESAAEKLRKQQESMREQKDKNAQLDKKQSLDRQRQQQDLENQAAQTEIDALDDSFEKIDRQRKLNNKKEIQSLERQKEDYINAVIQFEKEKFDAEEELKSKQIKGYVKNTFDSSTVKVDTSAFDGIIGNTSKKQLNDKVREQEDSWNEYLIKYGDYQQKRLAIIEKYDKLIKGVGPAGDVATLEKDKQNAVDDLDNSIKNSATLMGQLFADASQKSANEIQKVIEKSELLMQYLGAVKDEKGNAQIGGKTVSKKDVLDLGISDNTLKNLETSTEQVEALRNAIDRLKGDLGGKSPFVLFETQIDSAIKKISQGGNKNISQGITEIGGAVTAFSPAVSKFGHDLGNIVGSDDLGNKISGIADSIGGLGQAALGVGQIMSGDIVGGIMGVVSGISQMVSSIEGLFGKSDASKVYEDMKEQLSAINDIYDRIIDKSKEEIVFGAGFASVKAAENALSSYYKKVANYRQLAEAGGNAGGSAGSRRYVTRANERLSGYWGDMSKEIGTSISSMWDMYNLSGDQLDIIRTQFPEAWSKIPSEITDSLNAIADCKNEAQELTDTLNAAMTGIDTDSFYNGFIDSLSDMDTSFEDMCDNFEGYLRKSIIAGLVESQYQDRINSLYQDWSNAAKSGDKITEDEAKELQNRYKGIVSDMMKDREEMANSFGWESSTDDEREASKKGIATASQDSVDENNGRLTVIQGHTYEINGSVKAIQSDTAKIAEKLSFLTNMDKNMSDMVRGNDVIISHLSNIEGYTANLVEMRQFMYSMKLGIDTLNTKGITLKR